jgi:hypothetical protein
MLKTYLSLCVAFIALVGRTEAQPAPKVVDDAKGVRRIPIPHREHGYGSFKSQVIASQDQLDTFLKQVEKQTGWNNRSDFVAAIRKAKLDFTNEALVLVRQREGSGSNRVTFPATELKGDKLICTIVRDVPMIGTADIADYCLALVVPSKQVRQVEVWVDKKRREVLDVPGK